MATLAGQRAQFTWALNQYNKTDDADEHAKFAKRMAKYIARGPKQWLHGRTGHAGSKLPGCRSRPLSPLINAAHHGEPQMRDRVYMIAYRKELFARRTTVISRPATRGHARFR